MTNFEAPEIKVVMFRTEDIATAGSSAGGGYEDNSTIVDGALSGWSYNTVQGGADGDFPL